MAPTLSSKSTGKGFLKLSSLIAFAFASACASPAGTGIKIAKTPQTVKKASLPELDGDGGEHATKEGQRKVGDLWVHRFSGSYRGTPVILREEVMSQEGNLLRVRYRLEEGDSVTELEIAMTRFNERVVGVDRIVDGEKIPGTMQDLDALMAKTVFVPDENEGRVASKSETCLIGKAEVDCEISQYKIFVGEEEALLSVSRNDEMGRDISGEITAVDGTVLYHAELIEMQHGDATPPNEEGVALVNSGLD